MFLEALQAVAMDRDLGAQELRVLNYMRSKIGFKNDWQSLNQAVVGLTTTKLGSASSASRQ